MAAFRFLALPGGLFAAPADWKPAKKPNLVLGVLSDTHLQVGWDGTSVHKLFPHTYVRNAMKLFKKRNIDALVHLGDASHRGITRELEFHRELFEEAFGTRGGPVKLFIVGNHEWYGEAFKGGGGVTAAGLWKDPVERAKHTLCADMPRRWEHVWGEKYEEVWHNQFSLRGTKPFFILSHRRHHAAFCQALKDFPNAIALFGHWHWSNADWKTIFFDADTFGGRFPNIQVGACRMDGGNAVTPSSEVKLPEDSSSWKGDNLPSRQAMIINIYDDMVVFERHEVGKGGKLGPDWVLPLGEFKPHPFSRDELKKTIGTPEFGKKANLVVAKGTQATKATKGTKKVDSVASVPSLKIKIPMADGNPESRVYAYEIVVVGDDPKAKLFKNAFFVGANAGVGHEPNHGVTEVEIPVSELPPGKKLTIDVSPCSSLGTKGKSISTTFRV